MRRLILAISICLTWSWFLSVRASDPGAGDPAQPASGAVATEQPSEGEGKPAGGESADAEQIAAWVRDLGDPQYVVRDHAMRALVGAGDHALKPVSEALSGSGLEVTTRAIYVLQQLALSENRTTEQAARSELERLAKLRVTAAARRAQEALTKLDEQLQARAISLLQRLGARFDNQHVEMGLPLQASVKMVEIGNDFRGEDRDVARLADLRDIEQVSFVGANVDKAWVRHVASMPNLSILKIKRVNIDNQTLALLKTIPKLTYLKLLYVPIDKGSFEHLQPCRRLSKLMLFGTRIQRDEANQFKQLVTGEIDHRNGAFLGISPQPGEPCVINSVTPDSAADRAGLRPGDIIIAFQNQRIEKFDDLTAQISQFDAGDAVQVDVIRADSQREKVEVVLGEWD